ncbi:growth arrest-specific protein 7-like isoform X1 [Pimephales promelas]|uniref:growth arrest-specific protein 7-like isoform X1 n=1 Tax=Pimephales promelas TaxID=90988 RepID=UPI00195597DF|nr:growth arrest-specific protein 7-like isoform X1 [Pimephales promelas]XP_039509742.1 growth arrest-specific protein 7-like isoform X1 [Pimephales promelas]KAG1935659.1 growth arrest-specific protein [Pimephales promelas]
MSGWFCRSLYAFHGDQHQQGLRFEAGEMIRITQALEGGWWEGEKDGEKGWFPSTYVQTESVSSPCPVDEPLPRDWRSYTSPQGRRYYVNTVSNETTWERPSSTPGSPRTPVKHKSSPPPAVNGFHANDSPLHQTEHSHAVVRKASTDQQSPVSTSPVRKQECVSTVTINCVTFPLPLHMSEQQLLKPDEWSYCDYFWADRKDAQGSAGVSGFEVLLQKQLKGKQMQREMAEFVRERIRIEEEYAKSLSKLSQIPLAAQEEGTLGSAWVQLKKSLSDEAEVHLKFSSKLQSEVEKPLLIFRENFKKDMKKFDHHMCDLRKQLAGRYAAVEKARKALSDRQKDLEVKTQQLEIKLSSKMEEDIKKARRKSTQAGDELMRCVDLYNQSQSKWFEEMVTSSLELERLEVERVEMIRQHLCQYTTLRHETDMFNQSTVEPVDKLLRSVDPARDRELWVKEHKTGALRPVDMEV